MPEQPPRLAEAPVDDGRPLRGNRLDGVGISPVGLPPVAEQDRAHLHDMRGIDQAGLQAHLGREFEQQAMIDARRLDDDPELAGAALDGQTVNVCERLEDRACAVRDIPLGRRARTGKSSTQEVQPGAADITCDVKSLSCAVR